jgi:hypothetical protein
LVSHLDITSAHQHHIIEVTPHDHRGTRTSMDNVKFVFEKLETPDHASRDTSENIFRDTDSLQLIKAAGVHILHAIIDAGLDKESAVELDDFRGDGSVENIKLHHDSIELGLVKLEADFLKWERGGRGDES